MPGLNVSSSEAEERSKYLTVESYDVHITVVPGSETFLSKCVARFSCNSVGYETFIDAASRRIVSATLNGSPVDVSDYDGETVYLKNLGSENELVIEMEALYSKNGEGLQYSIDPADQEVYLYSQGAPAHIRHMFACFDQPDLKAQFSLIVRAPSYWEVVSNSPVLSKIEDEEGSATWQFQPTPRISTYIAALIAGPYHHVHDEYVGKKRIPLGIYCRKSLAAHLDQDNIFQITKQGFEYFENTFGLAYPFEKYDQIAVVDFNWGAMENPGAVTFKEDVFVFRSKVTERIYKLRACTILHEMSHMWFGNMVTMQWWDDLWLNESFAEWASYLALDEGTEFENSWTSFNSLRKNWAYRQDQLSSTHPIVVEMADIEAVNANFDGITYAKGASVLQQLVSHVGRDNFILGLQKYFAKHAFKNTTLRDLLVELEATSGRDLKPWSITWLESAGVNTLRPIVHSSGDIYTSIAIKQEPPVMPTGSSELRPHRLAVGLYDTIDGKIELRRSIELDVSGEFTQVPELTGEKLADLMIINDRDLTYAKIRFDERSISTLKQNLGAISDSLSRALCWSAAWDMLRDAEIRASDFVEIALSGLPTEDDITVTTMIAEQLANTLDFFTHPSKQKNLRLQVANGLEALLVSSTPGSDQQLQFARAFASIASSPVHSARIRSLLDGQLEGLEVDTDLRWHFVKSLIERNFFTAAELDLELERDNTTNGQLAHAFGLAAFGSVEAKANAWAQITDDSLPNSTRVALMQGFQRALHRDLLEAYVDDYFEMLLEMWNRKSFEAAANFVKHMYPAHITTQTTLDKTNYWLEVTGESAPAGLRRLVAEGRDSLDRALKVQGR